MADLTNTKTLKDYISDLAVAIKEKLDTNAPDKMTLPEMPDYINSIPPQYVPTEYYKFVVPVIPEGGNTRNLELILSNEEDPHPNGFITNGSTINYEGNIADSSGNIYRGVGIIKKISGKIWDPEAEEYTLSQTFWEATPSDASQREIPYTWEQLKIVADNWRDGSTDKLDEFDGYIGYWKTVIIGDTVWYCTLIGVEHETSDNEYMTFLMQPEYPLVQFDTEDNPFIKANAEIGEVYGTNGSPIGNGYRYYYENSPADERCNYLLQNSNLYNLAARVENKLTYGKAWSLAPEEAGNETQYENMIGKPLDGKEYTLFERIASRSSEELPKTGNVNSIVSRVNVSDNLGTYTNNLSFSNKGLLTLNSTGTGYVVPAFSL